MTINRVLAVGLVATGLVALAAWIAASTPLPPVRRATGLTDVYAGYAERAGQLDNPGVAQVLVALEAFDALAENPGTEIRNSEIRNSEIRTTMAWLLDRANGYGLDAVVRASDARSDGSAAKQLDAARLAVLDLGVAAIRRRTAAVLTDE